MWRRNQPGSDDLRDSSDEELVAALAEFDEAALRQLFRRYAPFITAMAERMGFGRESANFTQAVFVRLWLESPRFDPIKANALTWIVTTAHRLAINSQAGGDTRASASAGTLPPGDASASEPIYVSEALDRLDPLASQLLELAFFGGLDHARLVEMSGRSPATVKTTMKRALASLHEAVAEVRE